VKKQGKKMLVIDTKKLQWTLLISFVLTLTISTVIGFVQSFNNEHMYPILSIVLNVFITFFFYLSTQRLGQKHYLYHLILGLSSILILLTYLFPYALILTPILYVYGIYVAYQTQKKQEVLILPELFQKYMLTNVVTFWILLLYVLMVKTNLLFLLIPLFMTFVYLISVSSQMIKKVEKSQYLFFISILSLIFMYLSTANTPLGSQYYNLNFDLYMVFIFLLSLTHLPFIIKLFKS
jgi:hypothetical protein